MLREPILYLVLLMGLPLLKAPTVFGAANLSTEELRALSQKMKSATQLSFDFIQIKTNTIRPGKQSKSNGKAIFSKPTKFRWELLKPPLLLIYDGKSLYEIDESTQIANKYQSHGQKSQEIQEVIDLVLDFDSLLQRYKVIESIKEDTKILMKLEPKLPGGLSRLEVEVDAASAAVTAIDLIFANKNRTHFEFLNPDRRAVPASTFGVPKGYKVLDKGI